MNKIYKYLKMRFSAGIASPMMVHDTEEASGGQFIEVKSGDNNTESVPKDGRVIYKFTVKDSGLKRFVSLSG